jgi:isopentenyl diphosphate isomerase/L-lactate dehydrogenase-like FMN-dependent dehydrogenase
LALKVLEDEFKACMGLSGCQSLSDLSPDLLIKVEEAKL